MYQLRFKVEDSHIVNADFISFTECCIHRALRPYLIEEVTVKVSFSSIEFNLHNKVITIKSEHVNRFHSQVGYGVDLSQSCVLEKDLALFKDREISLQSTELNRVIKNQYLNAL